MENETVDYETVDYDITTLIESIFEDILLLS